MTYDTLDVIEGARSVTRLFRTPVLSSFLHNYKLLFSLDPVWGVDIQGDQEFSVYLISVL